MTLTQRVRVKFGLVRLAVFRSSMKLAARLSAVSILWLGEGMNDERGVVGEPANTATPEGRASGFLAMSTYGMNVRAESKVGSDGTLGVGLTSLWSACRSFRRAFFYTWLSFFKLSPRSEESDRARPPVALLRFLRVLFLFWSGVYKTSKEPR